MIRRLLTVAGLVALLVVALAGCGLAQRAQLLRDYETLCVADGRGAGKPEGYCKAWAHVEMDRNRPTGPVTTYPQPNWMDYYKFNQPK
jgi:hypothetical protein